MFTYSCSFLNLGGFNQKNVNHKLCLVYLGSEIISVVLPMLIDTMATFCWSYF